MPRLVKVNDSFYRILRGIQQGIKTQKISKKALDKREAV